MDVTEVMLSFFLGDASGEDHEGTLSIELAIDEPIRPCSGREPGGLDSVLWKDAVEQVLDEGFGPVKWALEVCDVGGMLAPMDDAWSCSRITFARDGIIG